MDHESDRQMGGRTDGIPVPNAAPNYVARPHTNETKNCETSDHLVRAKALLIGVFTMSFFNGGSLVIVNFQSNLDRHSELCSDNLLGSINATLCTDTDTLFKSGTHVRLWIARVARVYQLTAVSLRSCPSADCGFLLDALRPQTGRSIVYHLAANGVVGASGH